MSASLSGRDTAPIADRLEVREASGPDGATLISRLFDRIWEVRGMVPPELITASLHNGGYGSVAWLGPEPVGAAFALVGIPLAEGGGPNLHSHAAGVLATKNSRDFGRQIKHHQWRWARERGFSTITWTFDPLVRRNAWFNIVKLGVEVTDYRVNFYGELEDGINAGEQSDRVLVKWRVDGLSDPPHGSPVGRQPGDVVIPTPPDIETTRKTNRETSNQWRIDQRGAFLSALDDGRGVVGLTESYDYVLRKDSLRGGTSQRSS